MQQRHLQIWFEYLIGVLENVTILLCVDWTGISGTMPNKDWTVTANNLIDQRKFSFCTNDKSDRSLTSVQTDLSQDSSPLLVCGLASGYIKYFHLKGTEIMIQKRCESFCTSHITLCHQSTLDHPGANEAKSGHFVVPVSKQYLYFSYGDYTKLGLLSLAPFYGSESVDGSFGICNWWYENLIPFDSGFIVTLIPFSSDSAAIISRCGKKPIFWFSKMET